MVYTESCTGSRGGSGADSRSLAWLNIRVGSREEGGSVQHQPGCLGAKPNADTSAASFHFGKPKVKGLEVLLSS